MPENFYIYSHVLDGIPVWDRSMPGTCEREAQDRVRDLRARGQDAFYTRSRLKHSWY